MTDLQQAAPPAQFKPVPAVISMTRRLPGRSSRSAGATAIRAGRIMVGRQNPSKQH